MTDFVIFRVVDISTLKKLLQEMAFMRAFMAFDNMSLRNNLNIS